MFDFSLTEILGCYEIKPRVLTDPRGRFVKVFHQDLFAKQGLETLFSEEYYSVSHRGVIRGLHFQTPPADHVKLVCCVHGEVFDVVLDLRIGSPTYGKTASFRLCADNGNNIYIPKGLAHGFCATSDVATIICKTTTVYAPQHDLGILWSSLDVDWPTTSPIVSERDRNLKPLSEFESPFTYE